MRRVGSLIAGLGLAAVAVVGGGCGPVIYTVNINSASQAVEEARQAGAAERAPYEYWYAAEHLTQAREFANEAEYQNASDMAGVAEEYGNRARDIARRRQHESGR